MTSRSLVLILAVSLLSLGASEAAAQRKKKAVKACGITAIPLSVGNQWIYEQVAHPNPLEDAQRRLLPPAVSKVTITVDSVETAEGVTTVGLTEVLESQVGEEGGRFRTDTRELKTTITCTATRLDISPDSFWFAGEPGGFWNLELSDLAREDNSQTMPIAKGKVSGVEWHDDLTFGWKRVPTEGTDAELGGGKFDLNRRLVVTGEESVTTTFGVYSTASKVGIETKGEITVDDSIGKGYILPEGLVTFFWLADGVGIVQVHNTFINAYQLTGATIAK